ncbi:MAG: hypothetical protein ACRD0W_24015, partial [Acidimicrobiales bacterium]
MAPSDPLYINQAPQENLLFGDLTDFEATAGTWVSNQNATVAQSTAQAHTGSGALSIQATAAANASARHVGGAGTAGIPVTAGRSYAASAWLRAAATGRQVQVQANWYDAGGVSLSTSSGPQVADTATGWVLAAVAAVAPVSAAFAVVIAQVVSPAASEIHYVDDVDFRGGPAYNAAELRRAQAMLLLPGVTDRFGARAGVRPHSTEPVTLAGTTWTVENLNAVVYPGLTGSSGPYVVQHPEESGSTTPADGTNDRIDALDLQIQDDDEDASGLRRARVVYVTGTPAGSPVPPALTANSLRLATILVGSGGTPAPALTVVTPYTVALGGVLPVRTSAELPSAGRYEGMAAFVQDTNALVVWD